MTKSYKANFHLMHSMMQESMHGFQGSSRSNLSASQTKIEVGNNLCQAYHYGSLEILVVWKYLLSCMDIESEGLDKTSVIDWIKRNDKEAYEKIPAATIEMMQTAIEKPKDTLGIADGESLIGDEVTRLIDDYRKDRKTMY